jgi:hypothetical protein
MRDEQTVNRRQTCVIPNEVRVYLFSIASQTIQSRKRDFSAESILRPSKGSGMNYL